MSFCSSVAPNGTNDGVSLNGWISPEFVAHHHYNVGGSSFLKNIEHLDSKLCKSLWNGFLAESFSDHLWFIFLVSSWQGFLQDLFLQHRKSITADKLEAYTDTMVTVGADVSMTSFQQPFAPPWPVSPHRCRCLTKTKMADWTSTTWPGDGDHVTLTEVLGYDALFLIFCFLLSKTLKWVCLSCCFKNSGSERKLPPEV